MIPTDNEFSTLYFFYGFILILILCGLLFKPNKKEFKIHFIFYILYSGYVVYIFSDKENFKGGNSLAVLLYSFVFPILHLIIFGIVKLMKFIIKNRTKK